MSNTLFNDAALNLKVEIPSGGIEHNQLNTTNVFTVTTSSSLSSANLKDLLDVDTDPEVDNGMLVYDSANDTFTLANTGMDIDGGTYD